MMSFLNYNRDYSCSVQQFVRMFRDNFSIEPRDLEDYQIKILMQRYAVNVAKNVNQGDKKSKKVTASQKFSANQKVFYFDMIRDFGNRNKGYTFEELPFLPLAERLVKSIRLYRPPQVRESRESFEEFIKKFGDKTKDQLTSA